MTLSRVFDIVFSLLLLFILLPLLIFLAFAVKLDSPGPILFTQERLGLNRNIFILYKFRTMYASSRFAGPPITCKSDPRVTKLGVILRKSKLDELPQLYNVLLGDMSFVGPRPEVPKYLPYYPHHLIPTIFSVRPGITDPASIRYRNESDLLTNSSDPESTYLFSILPKKLRISASYILRRNIFSDFACIFLTLFALFN